MKNWELKETDQLEKESDWNTARDKLYYNWKENPHDLKVFFKLSFLCWYLVVEWDVENTSKVQESDYDDYKELLQELYQYGIIHFKEDAFFNAVFGFLIELFQEYFGEDYDKTKEFGESLINKSFNLNIEDPFIELISLYDHKGMTCEKVGAHMGYHRDTIWSKRKQIKRKLEELMKKPPCC